MATTETYASQGTPSGNFSFTDVFRNFVTTVKPIIDVGIQNWGAIEIAKANASAQAKLNQLKQVNPTLGSNQPAAAEKEASKTLAEKWLPDVSSSGGVIRLVILGVFLLALVWIVRALFKK